MLHTFEIIHGPFLCNYPFNGGLKKGPAMKLPIFSCRSVCDGSRVLDFQILGGCYRSVVYLVSSGAYPRQAHIGCDKLVLGHGVERQEPRVLSCRLK